jgi:hypothetical protein
METPDILNSKIKKIRIELPHYNFSHSSSGDSPHHFIGRERTKERLKKIIEDSPDEPGVYLIAGNRGVGKTNLISKVIKETSLEGKSRFLENLKYLILLFLAVVVVQFCLQKFGINEEHCIIRIISPLIFILSFFSLCISNDYRRKFPKKTSCIKHITDAIISAFKELSYLNSCKSTQIALKTILIISFTLIFSIKVLFGYLAIVFLYMCINKRSEKNNIIYQILYDSIINPINNYIKNRNRLYLRINFGHKLNDEKDILRLIARTLNTEYNKYRRSFRQMLPWRVIAFVFLFIFAYLLSDIVEKQEITNDWKHLEFVFSKVDSIVKTKTETKLDTIKTKTEIKVETKADTKIGAKISNLLSILNKFISEIPKSMKSDEIKVENIISRINYIFLLLFFSMYIFCVLLFRCNWITHFFVTHGIIMRRLKKLNIDITHSTERENSMGIAGYNSGIIGPGILSKTKKSRNVADAREIEKELQDILDDMQRIPILMCRPKIVIVFDELDKVESGDTSLEKEIPQTKASMFSINATRERQTEILRILSNLKYFLSSAKAKFIFIAGREMFDFHLADVSERNNYIGSIFNAVIYVPSFLTDHPTGKKSLRDESSIAALTEEFVCRRLIPHDYPVEFYDLKNYQKYLKKKILCDDKDDFRKEKIQKIIAVLQQFIIYLAHLSKGAPKKMMQLFESFVIVSKMSGNDKENSLVVQRYHNSRHFLSFSYYRQYTLGIVAYLITPIFYRLSESNIKEHSDKLLVSALRFVDFVFKFHKHPFSYKHLDISPEMQEVNRAPELKSVAVDLLNYLTQVHINKSSFSLSEYKFDSLIANEIFAMAKTDDVFSALFSFSLDELSPLKNHYKDLLEKTEKTYRNEKDDKIPIKYIDAISSLQAVLGDLYYYDDGLEEAEAYYKSSVQAFNENENNRKTTLEQLYVYVRNMLRLGIIYEKRKQYDFAYLTYNELCKRIQLHLKNSSPCYNIPSEKTAYGGLKMLYLPFLAKFQIQEQSHLGGITYNHLEQLDKEFESLTSVICHEDAKILKAEFYSQVANILYYKNSNFENSSYSASHYYHKALSALLEKSENDKVEDLLCASVERINGNYNMKFCTTLARILSDYGNVFFSCDTISKNASNDFLDDCIEYIKSEKDNQEYFSSKIKELNAKKDIAFAMYAISLHTYRKASLHKRASYQIYKMLCLFKHYGIDKPDYIKQLSKKSLNYLWRANENLGIFELNKRKKDFNKETIKDKNEIPLQNLLVDSEITRIRILVKELGLKSSLTPEKLKLELKGYYGLHITSPYRINYSIVGRIYRLRLKSKVNYEAYKMIINNKDNIEINEQLKIILGNDCNKEAVRTIFGKYFGINDVTDVTDKKQIEILENLIAETIYCLIDSAQLLETMDETYLFPHSFLGSIHKHLSFWIRLYETYEKDFYEKYKDVSRIKKLLKQYLDEEWREQLSGHRENKKALSHYYKCLEMHNEGKAYHNMIDTMCYVRDDYNDRSDHFNIAEERHLIVNGEIEKKINYIKDIYKDSKLYEVDNYFEKDAIGRIGES